MVGKEGFEPSTSCSRSRGDLSKLYEIYIQQVEAIFPPPQASLSPTAKLVENSLEMLLGYVVHAFMGHRFCHHCDTKLFRGNPPVHVTN